ncbi:LacI family DNA-binding transcriptional regulator [Lysinimonas soli]|uniref:LacI family DNA-binding transcriptional regulator n=1 Tax=Lysinimonas soli TaxID=1074233 RepID=A0ABW0NQP4_9MICO
MTAAQRPRPVTRTDVARRAGVSSAVVSYVVNAGPRNVAPETRERVLRAIEELGYRPNASARALKRGVSETIGLIVSDITNPFFSEYSHAIEEAAAERGLSVIFTNSALAISPERDVIYKMILRGVDGLILASTLDEPELDAAKAAGIPVVLIDRAHAVEGHASIGSDFREASRVAVEHLLGHGHTRIGFVTGYSGGSTTTEREAGGREAILRAGLEPGPVVRAQFSRDGGYDAGIRMLQLPERPTAVYVMSDQQAIGFLNAVHEAGLRIPGEMAVVSFDGSTESEFSWPPLTTMRQPVREMARAAVGLLSLRDADSLVHHTFEAPLLVRSSCGCNLPLERPHLRSGAPSLTSLG